MRNKAEVGAAQTAPNDKHNITKNSPDSVPERIENAPVIRAYPAFEAAVVMADMLNQKEDDISLLEETLSKLQDDVIFHERFNACIEHNLKNITEHVLSHTAEINAVAHDVVARFGAGFESADESFAQLNADIETYVSEHKDDDPDPDLDDDGDHDLDAENAHLKNMVFHIQSDYVVGCEEVKQ
jgi:hypothetical protein